MASAKSIQRHQRIALTQFQKHQVCKYATSNPHLKNYEILNFVRELLNRPNFPQSTLSSLLIKNGIRTGQPGQRGRPHTTKTDATADDGNVNNNNDNNNTNTSILIQPASQDLLKNDNLMFPAPGVCRTRTSGHSAVDEQMLALLLETISQGQRKITRDWLRKQAILRLRATKEHFNGRQLSQYLKQLETKYYLAYWVGKFLSSSGDFSYQNMLDKISIHFPSICYAAVPGVEAAAQVKRELPDDNPIAVSSYDLPAGVSVSSTPSTFHVPIVSQPVPDAQSIQLHCDFLLDTQLFQGLGGSYWQESIELLPSMDELPALPPVLNMDSMDQFSFDQEYVPLPTGADAASQYSPASDYTLATPTQHYQECDSRSGLEWDETELLAGMQDQAVLMDTESNQHSLFLNNSLDLSAQESLCANVLDLF